MKSSIAQFQYITNHWSTLSHEEQTELVCKAGCKWVQLRVKDTELTEWIEIAKRVQAICKKYNARFIMNDNVELANELNADGVHLGQNDMSPDEARVMLGDESIIGATANTLEQIIKLSELNVDYIGLGPFTFTNTKKNLSPVLGLEGYKKIIDQLKEKKIETPIIAIGGITLNDITPILETGVYGIAISSLISDNQDPVNITNKILKTINC